MATLALAGVLCGGLVTVAQVTAPPQVAQTLGARIDPASAATPVGTDWQLTTNSLVLAAFSIPGVPGLFYCASATAPAPLTDDQRDLGELDLGQLRANNLIAMRPDLTPNVIAGVNRMQHVYGQDPSKQVEVAAVSGATHWALQGGEISAAEFGGNTDLHAAVRWAINRDPDLKGTNVADLAVRYYNEAMSYRAADTVTAGTVTVTGTIDPVDNYRGTVTVTPSVAGGNVAFELVNAKLTDGSTRFSGTLSGAKTLAVRGVPPVGTQKYKIGVTAGRYTVTGMSGYSATLHAFTTPGAQMIVVGGAQSPSSASTAFAWTSPRESSAAFQPAFASQLGKPVYHPGDAPVDHFTVDLAPMAGGLINEWPVSSAGVYAPLPVIATMYLLKAPLATVAAVPAGAKPVARGTATVGGGKTDPTTDGGFDITLSKLTGTQAELSGHVTVVLTVDTAKLAANTSALLPAGWAASYATPFGDPRESAVIPPEIITRASAATGLTVQVNDAHVPATGAGLPLYESYTVNGYVDDSEELYVLPRHYTTAGTIDSEGMLQNGSLECTPATLDVTGEPIAITRAGGYDRAWKITSARNGLGTFTHQFVTAAGTPVGPESSCQDPAEWTAQQQLLIHTVAAQNSSGLVRDTAYVFGTVEPGSQLIANLHDQTGDVASVRDEIACTTEAVGIPQGLANGVTVTTPWTQCPAFDGARYFREIALDVDGNVRAHGRPGVASEYLPREPAPSAEPAVTPTPSETTVTRAPEPTRPPTAAPQAPRAKAPTLPAPIGIKSLPTISG
ncbi:hypothetical protein ACFOYW_10700 [Gryllotalpicola reticulitermitis]|uniref:TQXA domain-containing protein n=1 Tax=Gryllotalpicola reticulitermitis TaxID=1184153 RepID=A0ABV8Q8N3_9MICO